MDIYSSFASRFDKTREEELSLEEYLNLCKNDPAVCIGCRTHADGHRRTEKVDTARSAPVAHLCQQGHQGLPAFKEFYGMEEVIEQVVSYFRHAAGLEEKKQILYLLGPVGGGKSSIAERSSS
jgi:serine protein kinase